MTSPEPDLASARARIGSQVVGRERELDLVLAAVAAGRDLLLEGPPGTSKTTLLRAITTEWGIPFVFVEGNADLTATRLIGHHNPARVLREDYSPDNFVDGPLLEAMRSGGFLYLEELNRAPDDTLNALLTAMADRVVAVPRVGTVSAAETFRVVASMNPFDAVGTARLSTSITDRLCRVAVDYQGADDERSIVALRAPLPTADEAVRRAVHDDAVALTRATRAHDDIRQGSSVRGAIDLSRVAAELLALRRIERAGDLAERATADHPERLAYAETMWDACVVSLSGRVHLDETIESTPEQVLHEIWEQHYVLEPASAAPG